MPGVRAQVAAVDAHAPDRDAIGPELGRELDHLVGRPLRIVGIDQQDGIIRMRTSEAFECRNLVAMRLHVGMGHRSVDRNPELPRGFDGRSSRETGEIACTRRQQTGLCTVGPTQAKVDQHPIGRREHAPRRLARDQRLIVDQIHDAALDQLCFTQGRADAEDRLVGKEYRALGQRIDVAGKAKSRRASRRMRA